MIHAQAPLRARPSSVLAAAALLAALPPDPRPSPHRAAVDPQWKRLAALHRECAGQRVRVRPLHSSACFTGPPVPPAPFFRSFHPFHPLRHPFVDVVCVRVHSPASQAPSCASRASPQLAAVHHRSPGSPHPFATPHQCRRFPKTHRRSRVLSSHTYGRQYGGSGTLFRVQRLTKLIT